jgi:hypothetical protein
LYPDPEEAQAETGPGEARPRGEASTGRLSQCAREELRLENADLKMRAAQYISHSQFSKLKSPFLSAFFIHASSRE